jgi:hypothetical protein
MSEFRTFRIRERAVDRADKDHRVRMPDDPAARAVRTCASLEVRCRGSGATRLDLDVFRLTDHHIVRPPIAGLAIPLPSEISRLVICAERHFALFGIVKR